MKTRKSILTLLLFLTSGVAFVYYWQHSLSTEFYPMLNKRCIKSVAYDKSLSGQLALIPQDPEGYQFLTDMFSSANVLYNLKTREMREMTPVGKQTITGNFVSSPDRKRLAYQERSVENRQEKQHLVIQSYRGSETRIEIEAGQSFVYWLDNYRLVIRKGKPEKLPEVVILNPDKAESQRFTPEYPDVIAGEDYQFWDNTWPVVGYYSPDMTRVLYPDDSDYDDVFYADLILYDEKHLKQLLRIGQIGKLDQVVWKQDGSGFYLAENNIPIGKDLNWASAELRFLDQNGIVKWKINFADFFSFPLARNLSLSPDERLLSFDIGNFYYDHWLFLDTATGDMFDFCLESDYPAVWSPDGKYVALASGSSVYEKLKTVIIDINNRGIYEIADGYIPVGWLQESR